MLKSFGKLFALAFGQAAGTGNVFHLTDKCPECGTKLMRNAERSDWHCPNLDCPAQIRARIEHWCSPGAMDIAGGDAALVALLVGNGLARDVAELYRIKVAELAGLPGMDKDSARKFFDAITASRKREAWRVLFGLNIPHVSPEVAKTLCRHFGSVDNVLAASIEQLQAAESVSEGFARSIFHWYGDSVNVKLVRRLFKVGVNFKA